MKTKVTELLGIEYPIIQGGMAWVADYHLAAAVSNAGGLGLIAAGGAPAEWELLLKDKEGTFHSLVKCTFFDIGKRLNT